MTTTTTTLDNTTPTTSWLFLEPNTSDDHCTPADRETLRALFTHHPIGTIFALEDPAEVSMNPDPRSAGPGDDQEIIEDPDACALLQVETTGQPSAGSTEYRVLASASPLDAVLPAPGRLRDVIVKLEAAMNTLRFSDSPFTRLYESRPGDFDHDAETYDEYAAGVSAARSALHELSYRHDGRYRGSEIPAVGSCQHGDEYTALAARDLIDTTPGWTQLAYDRIRLRYERAFGETLHPDDQPLPGIEYTAAGTA